MASPLDSLPSWQNIPFFEATIAFIFCVYAFENWIRWRQYCRLFAASRPALLTDEIVSEADFQSAQLYERDKLAFAFVHDAVETARGLFFLGFCLLPVGWRWSADALAFFGVDASQNEIPRSLLFMFSLSLLETALEVPFSLYRTFTIEERHGFNKQTYRLWATDLVNSLGLSFALGAPIGWALLSLIKWGGEYFYLWVCFFQLALQLIMTFLYPVLIQPCFDKVTPLRDGALRGRIEALAARLNYPLKKLFEIDGSTRSAHSNAYQYGFCGNKHIVLYDTLLESTADESVEAVVAHELGHWQRSHVPKLLLVSLTNSCYSMFLFGFALRCAPLYAAFGFHADVASGALPTLIGLMLASYITSPLSHLVGLAMNALTRRFEFEADAFAVGLGFAAPLRKGLIALNRQNKSSYNPDWIYAMYHYSHPPLIERLRAIGGTEEMSRSKSE